MLVIAKLNYLRISPRKVRLVADLIRGKSTEEAQTILNFTVKKAAKPLTKLLNQAIANAKNNFQLDPSNLLISKIEVCEGPKYKRWQPRARGRVSEIQKKTSHVKIVLAEIKEEVRRVKKAKKIKKAPVPKIEKIEKALKLEKPQKRGKPPGEQAKMRPEKELAKPKFGRGLKKVFRRKAF